MSIKLNEARQQKVDELGFPWRPVEKDTRLTGWFDVEQMTDDGMRPMLYVDGKFSQFVHDACHQHHALMEKVERLREALKEFGDHKPTCAINSPLADEYGCTCGLDKALKETEVDHE